MPIPRLDVRTDPLLVSGDLALEAGDFDEVLTPVDGSEPVLIERTLRVRVATAGRR